MRRFVAILLLLILIGCTPEARPLKPLRATSTPGGVILPEPRALTFAQIATTPQQFINQSVRVTGSFAPLELESCAIFKGPTVQWGMVADNLQMNAVGFESVVEIVPNGTEFTVDGIWRLYNGPAGCGKEPPTASIWYIEVTQILKPNPISQFGTMVDNSAENPDQQVFEEGENVNPDPNAVDNTGGEQVPQGVAPAYPVEAQQPEAGGSTSNSASEVIVPPTPTFTLVPPTPTASITPTPRPGITPSPTSDTVATATATATSTSTATATATTDATDATATSTTTAEAATATATVTTDPDATETPTPDPDATATETSTPTMTPTADPDATATPTVDPEATATPTSATLPEVLPTDTPDPDATPTETPTPTMTPTITPTSDGYPVPTNTPEGYP